MSVSTPENVAVTADDVERSPEMTETAEAVETSQTTELTETAEAVADEPTTTFADLGLADAVVRKLAQNGVTTPFPIQAATIPDALAGKDILGRGRTGSGKTLSFGLPTLTRLAGGRTARHRPRAVLLTPTRELAMQVSDALQPYGDVLGLKLKVVCGGTSMGNQIGALERGVDILVATPGRLRDLINRGACSLDDVEVAVLDEADQMADLGFLPEVTEILDLVPDGGQRMLFSATLEREIDTLVKRYLVDPVSHEVDAAQGAVTTMTHHILIVKPQDKAPVTAAIAARKGRTIAFVRTQMGADRVAEQLRAAGVRADALHGGMTQGSRTRTLADFKDGRVNVLVATDVAARGIHVDGIDLVLNVDPAGDHKDYLHRSGRTARAGQSGTVVSLALPHQRRQTFRLMEDAGVDATRHLIGRGDVFDDDVAAITGARSLSEVQAEAAANSARQAEREVAGLARKLEEAKRRAVELRDEAGRLTARAARDRGADADEAVAHLTEEMDRVATEEAERLARAAARAAEQERKAAQQAREDRKREGSGFQRRDDRRGGFNRDRDRGGDRGGFRRSDDRDRGDRGGERGGFRRSDDRPYGRRDDRGGYPRREGGFNRDRRDDRGGFRRSDDRPFNRDDRPFNRDHRDRRGDDRRPYGRRDDHRGASGTGNRSFGRRADKPRWKHNG
ncbi:DEAD/DEAH box helicase [Streptomyces sp. WMMC1477]|uniref:DEAD/DEAH box helicase n=1 Tax=Streptomyces sp. WMMC1477 TaxID=3015155 RepID=UPI0022B66FA8|nr:DEAD/DEAH box helicase [Streptomyces sp. WMMC1477]MCZ7432235.1 DEAD/DEAH box helicase [Streptomyces sp. WMMC1477]